MRTPAASASLADPVGRGAVAHRHAGQIVPDLDLIEPERGRQLDQLGEASARRHHVVDGVADDAFHLACSPLSSVAGFADPAASGAHDMPALRGSHLVLLWSATLVAVLFRAIKQAPATKPHSARHLLGQPRDVGINWALVGRNRRLSSESLSRGHMHARLGRKRRISVGGAYGAITAAGMGSALGRRQCRFSRARA